MKIYLDNNLGVTNVEQEELTQDTIGYNILKVYIPNAVLTPYDTFTCYYGALLQNGRKVGWFAMEARTSTDADYEANYTLYKATLEQCVVSVEGKVYIGCQILLGNSGNATLIKKNTAVVQFNVRKSVAINNDILVLDPDQTNTDVLESYKNLLENALTTYATKAEVYTKSQVDALLLQKADRSTTYTKTEVDSALATKADKSDTYTKQEVNTLLAPKVAHSGNQLKDKDGNNIYPNIIKDNIPNGITIKTYNIIESTPSAPYNDFNTVPSNTIVTYANITNVSNLPETSIGTLLTYNYTNNMIGCVQIYVTNTNKMYYRINWANNWKDWVLLTNVDLLNDLSYLNYLKPLDISLITFTDNKYIDKNGNIGTSNGFFYSSKILLRKGETIFIKGVGYSSNVSMISEYINDTTYKPLVISTSSNLENYSYTATKDMYIVYSGRTQYKNYIWYSQNNIEYIRNNNYVTFSLFSSFGVIGDSYASGNIYINNVSQGDIYKYSWGQILARKSGVNCVNFSKSGLHTRSWLNNQDYGLNKLLNTPKQDLYIIALGLNDAHTLGLDYLGSISDIRTDYQDNPDTFYGNYARIIENIRNYSNKSKIIISTMPHQDIEIRKTFNNAIVEIANYYHLPLIDINMSYLCNYKFYYKNFDGGHPVAISYSTMCNMYEDMIEKSVVENKDYFMDISNL